MSAKEIYRQLCETETSIPIFSRAWWLDAAAGVDNWDVVIVEADGQVQASLPYVKKRRFGMTMLTQPSLTQTVGPWLRPADLRYAKRLSRHKELMHALIRQLPSFAHYIQHWHYSCTDWLPFYWAGFQQTTRYTYVIDDLSDPDQVCAGFSHAKRKDIKKAEDKIRVSYDLSAEAFYENHKMTLALQGSRISYSFELLRKLYDAGYCRDAARTIAGFDEHGNLHAALFVIWDENSAYDLISTIDPRFRGSGAPSLLIREIIRHVATRTKKFDFEGSMQEDIAASFKQFNTRQIPYFQVSKTPSRLYATAKFLRSLQTGN